MIEFWFWKTYNSIFLSNIKLLNIGYWAFIIISNFVVISEQLGKPSIRLLHNILDAEECVISLECQRTSENGQISFSWNAENFNDTLFWDSPAESGKSVLWTTFKPNRPVTFSCIAAAGNRKQSRSRNVMCKGMFTMFIKGLQMHLGITRLQ